MEAKRSQRFRLDIAYQGNAFHGWQQQGELQESFLSSVSACLAQAITKATATSDFLLHGSGRTDAGVHARQQTAHLEVETRLDPATLQRAINSNLPATMRVLRLEPRDANFHAQRSALAKTYRYFILHRSAPGNSSWPFLENWVWYITQPLDYGKIQAGLKCLEGKHDFAAFQNVGTKVAHTVREIYSADLIVHATKSANPADLPWLPPENLGLVLVEFRLRGKGFLKQMVRNIVGTMVEVGKGKMDVLDLPKILAAKSRHLGGPTAPAQGLILNDVEYESEK